MTILKHRSLLLAAILLFAGYASNAQKANATDKTKKEGVMKTYLIEREIPDAGKFTAVQLKDISKKSCSVLKEMDGIEWIQSYVTGNKIFCVYKAQNEELIREHGAKGGFPVTNITEIGSVISPATAK